MKPYNSYSGDLRTAAQRWLNAEIASGRMTRPTLCIACAQNQGVIDMHAEDYSQPFAAGKTDEFHLCFPCHMAVHCRFRSPEAWDAYRAMVARGDRTKPFMTRNFPTFISLYFRNPTQLDLVQPFYQHGEAPERLVLDEIDGWLLAHTGKGWR